MHAPHPIAACKRIDERTGAIRRIVIDDHDLGTDAGFCEHVAESGGQSLDAARFVIGWNDHGDDRVLCHWLLIPSCAALTFNSERAGRLQQRKSYHHFLSAATAANNATAAVSVRKIVCPSDTMSAPVSRALSSSAGVKLPSGPIASDSAALSRASARASDPAAAPSCATSSCDCVAKRSSAAFQVIASSTCGRIRRRDCCAADRAMFRQRTSLVADTPA